MLFRVKSSALSGLTAVPVDVEVEVSSGRPNYTIIGMGDVAVRESRDRVISALKSANIFCPPKILVNLAPAELKKEGAAFDLAIAVAAMASALHWHDLDLSKCSFHGELSLNGNIRPVRGIVAHAIEALEQGLTEIIVPRANEAEARLVSGIKVTPIDNFSELVMYLKGEYIPETSDTLPEMKAIMRPDFSDVFGQQNAKRALVIAAAGGHNLIMVGPPGCGKSMLAERFSSLLPPLSREEILETAKIHSVNGLPIANILNGDRPYRAPHHTISEAGLVGGGSTPKPGEVSLAHNGVLFLDEFPEFRRGVIEGLRQPLETGRIRISRAKLSTVYPASFQLLAAMNPCPCGRLGVKGSTCLCAKASILHYLKKLSLPILDRIDLQVAVEAVPFHELSSMQRDSQARYKDAVEEARARALHRANIVNAKIRSSQVDKLIKPEPAAISLLKRMSDKSMISARGYFRLLKVARTIADLRGAETVSDEDLAEAATYRTLHRLEQYCLDKAI